jgi:ectoine hydroxylase-related dioxygenase (phytanoyl-CoA dioxygenase family)
VDNYGKNVDGAWAPDEEFRYRMETQGYCLFENVIDAARLERLRTAIDDAFENDKRDLEAGRFKCDAYTADVSRLLIGRDAIFADLIDESRLQDKIDEMLGDTCIINNYSGVRLLPGTENVVTNIHRDSPRFSPQFKLAIQILYFVDDFTHETGGTWVLPGSHRSNEKPPASVFFEQGRQITGTAGTAMVFDSMLWHAGGRNVSQNPRRGIAIVYTRSFIKQQIDIVRAIPSDTFAEFSDKVKRLSGFNVRVPASLSDFYLPEEERMYKANQG